MYYIAHYYVHLEKSSCEGDAQCRRTTWKIAPPSCGGRWREYEGFSEKHTVDGPGVGGRLAFWSRELRRIARVRYGLWYFFHYLLAFCACLPICKMGPVTGAFEMMVSLIKEFMVLSKNCWLRRWPRLATEKSLWL